MAEVVAEARARARRLLREAWKQHVARFKTVQAHYRAEVDEARKQHVLSVLKFCRGNRTWAAHALGLTHRGLRLYIARHLRDDPSLPPASNAYSTRRRRVL